MENKKPQALILDDMPSRHKTIIKDNPEFEFHSSLDIWDAQDFIKNNKIDILFLDYDLCDFNNASAIVAENAQFDLTGADFLAYMLTEVPNDNWPDKVIVISINEKGAQECMWLLKVIGIPATHDPMPN